MLLVEVGEILAARGLVRARGRSRSGWRCPRAPASRTGTRTPRRWRPSRSARAPPARADAGAASPSHPEVQVPLHALLDPVARTTPSSVPGSTKNSISICSNSRVRKMKFPGVISLRNDLPICAMPNGSFLRVDRLDRREVDEHALRRLRPQVRDRVVVLDRPDEGLEHQVELPRLGELGAAAVRAA